MWINLEQAESRYKKSRQYLNKVFNNGNAIRRKTKEHGIQYDQDTYDNFFGFSGEQIKEPPPENNTKNEIHGEEPKPAHSTTLTKVNIALKLEAVKAKKHLNKVADESVVDRKDTEALFFTIGRAVRGSLEAIPPRISGLLVDKTKHEIEQALTEEFKTVLTNLSLNL